MGAPAAAPVAQRVVPPSRLFLFAIVMLPLMSLPQIYVDYDFYLPVLSDLCMVPVSLAVTFKPLFHESGHMISQWVFGHPAKMIFYPAVGTAATHFAPQNTALLQLIYFFFALSGAYLYAKKDYRKLCILCIIAVLHIILAMTVLHTALGMCMGHGGEMLAGATCAWLCLFYGDRWTTANAAIADAIWRAAGAALGIYLIWDDMMYMIPFMLGGPRPAEFSPVNGQRAINDIELAAGVLGTGTQGVAAVLFTAGLSCICFIGYKALKRGLKK